MLACSDSGVWALEGRGEGQGRKTHRESAPSLGAPISLSLCMFVCVFLSTLRTPHLLGITDTES
jgi:hypothetical protein